MIVKDTDVIKALAKSKASANRVAKSLETKMIKAAITNLQTALKTLEAREAAKHSRQRESNIKKLAAMMAEMGLSASDLAGGTTKKAGKKSAAKAKVNDLDFARLQRGSTCTSVLLSLRDLGSGPVDKLHAPFMRD